MFEIGKVFRKIKSLIFFLLAFGRGSGGSGVGGSGSSGTTNYSPLFGKIV